MVRSARDRLAAVFLLGAVSTVGVVKRLGLLTLGAILTAILAPQSALADVTHSAITTPAATTSVWVDLTNRTGSLDVAGTSDGTTGDAVDIVCTYVDEDGPETDDLQDEVPVDAAGNFSITATSVDLGGLRGDSCILRAIPTDSEPDDLSPFTGPPVMIGGIQRSSLQTGPNAGTVYDYDIVWPQPAGVFETESMGACGIADSGVYGPGPTRSVSLFYCGAFSWPSDGVRDMILVDGHPAYTPWGSLSAWAVANSGSTDVPGIQGVTVDAAVDPASGDLTIHETTPLVVCNPSPDTYPATPDSCAGFADAGVVLHRTVVQDKDGRVATVRDAWSSTNGAAHQLDLESETDFASAAALFQLGWSRGAGFTAYTPGTSVQVPEGGPVSIYQVDSSVPSTDPTYAVGAVSLGDPPDSVAFTRGTSSGASAMVLSYRRTVPASGVLELDSVYSQAATVAAVESLASAAEDALGAPVVDITSPKDGATISTSSVTVTGTAHDAGGIASLTVDGHSVKVSDDGTWSTTVSLSKGRNEIDAVAKDDVGNTATASVTVTATSGSGPSTGLPAPPPDPPPGLRGCQVPPRLHGQPLKVAKRAILTWHCRPGTVVKQCSKTVVKGLVIGTKPKAGTRRKAGTHIIILKSKGKKPKHPAPKPHARGGNALRLF
jgi:hypothetical protein